MAYAIAYQGRYKDWPLWNESVAGQIIKFIDKVGAERAPRIAVHYVRRVEEKFICDQLHPVGLLLSHAQKWATQQNTGASTPPPSLAPAASHKFAGAGKAIFDGIEL